MLRIRKVRDIRTPSNRAAVEEVQAIIRSQFPGMPAKDIEKLPDQLENPFAHRFVSQLLVSESARGTVRAFALLLYAPDLRIAYLETISAAPGRTGGGLGAAIYDGVREEALALGANGLYFECLPDDPQLSPDPRIRRQNAARLRFYERYGARPIIGTAYQTPLKPGATDSPYLMFDGLGRFKLPDAEGLKLIVRAILESKYADICPPGYIDMVADSIKPGGFRLRPPCGEPSERAGAPTPPPARLLVKVPLVVNDLHTIHHIRERGYVEAPVRVSAILRELEKTDYFERMPARPFPDRWIREVHDGALVDYIQHACAEAPVRKSIYPYVFPIRNATRRPKDRSVLAGYWCIDTFTPLNRNAYPAARHGVDCVLTAAETVASGAPLAYALVRPPGHHAERRAFGGFCYFSNAAIAANYLLRHGRVAILDIDYHHGNGQQEIFYERSDVLTVSVHGHPSFAYPYFTGFADERGRGAGAGYNLNIPLKEATTPEEHREAVRRALRRVARHEPAFVVLALGYDTAKGDPTGTWSNGASDFAQLGRMIGETGYPTVVVQEGGYRTHTLGVNARNFFAGLVAGAAAPLGPRRRRPSDTKRPEPANIEWRETVGETDVDSIRRLVAGTDMFTTAEVEIAAELVQERVARGRMSGYEFILAEADGRLLGYACYGPTPATDTTYDLYWIVVGSDVQRHGFGRAILAQVEDAVRQRGGRYLYVDTSSTEKYEPTRAFYRRSGFRKAAELADFYREGDGKVIFAKRL